MIIRALLTLVLFGGARVSWAQGDDPATSSAVNRLTIAPIAATPAIIYSRVVLKGIGPTAGVLGIEEVRSMRRLPGDSWLGLGVGVVGAGARLLMVGSYGPAWTSRLLPGGSRYISVGAGVSPWLWGPFEARALVSAEIGLFEPAGNSSEGGDVAVGVARLVDGTWFGNRWLITVRYTRARWRRPDCKQLPVVRVEPVTLIPHDSIPDGTVRGRVAVTEERISMAGAVVDLPDLRIRALVDTASRFQLERVPVGEHRVIARRIGFRPTVGSVVVPRGHGSAVVISMVPDMHDYDECGRPRNDRRGTIHPIP